MQSELALCLAKCRTPLVAVGLLSCGSTILALSGSLFMLTVYDRVIPSGSIPSLVALGVIALISYVIQGVIDVYRSRMLTRVGQLIKEALNSRVYDIMVRNGAQGRQIGPSAVRDVDQIQTFMSSLGPTALFDLPWLPIFLGICFAFHPYIGLSVIGGAGILILLTVLNNYLTKGPLKDLSMAISRRDAIVNASQNNAETIEAMGMTYAMSGTWIDSAREIAELSLKTADLQTTVGTSSRISRMALQSFVLAVGAYLVINQMATGGVIIAGSILSARALAPIELAIAHWKNFISMRQAWSRMNTLLKANPPEEKRFALPPPAGKLTVQGVCMTIPGQQRLILRDVSFELQAGKGLGIIGPTGSGKSTLVRALTGLWKPVMGTVRLDGMEIQRWSALARGRFIGYLPQKVSLFEGTIGENIARFEKHADPASITKAAMIAGVHEMIARMPEGYDTKLDANGGGLSGGQAQRIGLARALYGDPFVLILDEPNSNLDREGEIALQAALVSVKQRNGLFVIVAHRPSILSVVDDILVLKDGRTALYGPRDQAMNALSDQKPEETAPVQHIRQG